MTQYLSHTGSVTLAADMLKQAICVNPDSSVTPAEWAQLQICTVNTSLHYLINVAATAASSLLAVPPNGCYITSLTALQATTPYDTWWQLVTDNTSVYDCANLAAAYHTPSLCTAVDPAVEVSIPASIP